MSLFGSSSLPWCINTGKSLIPLTLLFLAQKRNLLIPLELSGVMHQGTLSAVLYCPNAAFTCCSRSLSRNSDTSALLACMMR